MYIIYPCIYMYIYTYMYTYTTVYAYINTSHLNVSRCTCEGVMTHMRTRDGAHATDNDTHVMIHTIYGVIVRVSLCTYIYVYVHVYVYIYIGLQTIGASSGQTGVLLRRWHVPGHGAGLFPHFCRRIYGLSRLVVLDSGNLHLDYRHGQHASDPLASPC